MQIIKGNISTIEAGEYTPTSDVNAKSVKVQHSLGVAPDFIIYFDANVTIDPSNTKRYMACGAFMKQSATNGMGAYSSYVTSRSNQFWSEALSNFCKESYFIFPAYNSDHKLKAGVTYHYCIGKISG